MSTDEGKGICLWGRILSQEVIYAEDYRGDLSALSHHSASQSKNSLGLQVKPE